MTGTQPVNAARPGASAGPVLDYRKNPFGLVYEDAITENEAGGANIHPVTYMLRGLKIAANIYTPANHDPSEKVPAIAVAHPNGGVKEQVAGRYAQRLAEQGYITIAADAAYQGRAQESHAAWTSPSTGPTTSMAWPTTSPATPA